MSTLKEFNLFEHHFTTNHNILISYKGPFDKGVLKIIGNYIKVILEDNPKAGKKIFKIFIELAQNISYYSAERSVNESLVGIGSLVIIETEGDYFFYTGNIVKKNQMGELIDKCELINTLDKDGLRDYKRKQLELPDSTYDGANIGLIQVAITSSNPLEFQAWPLNEEESFFIIAVRVNKQ